MQRTSRNSSRVAPRRRRRWKLAGSRHLGPPQRHHAEHGCQRGHVEDEEVQGHCGQAGRQAGDVCGGRSGWVGVPSDGRAAAEGMRGSTHAPETLMAASSHRLLQGGSASRLQFSAWPERAGVQAGAAFVRRAQPLRCAQSEATGCSRCPAARPLRHEAAGCQPGAALRPRCHPPDSAFSALNISTITSTVMLRGGGGGSKYGWGWWGWGPSPAPPAGR